MDNFLILVAVIFIIFWLVGIFVFNAGAMIHTLFVMALVAVFLRVIRKELSKR